MTPTSVNFSSLGESLQQVADAIRSNHRSLLVELQIEVVEGGVILRGHAVSFYGKQVALHEARRRCDLAVVANQITVSESRRQAVVTQVLLVPQTALA